MLYPGSGSKNCHPCSRIPDPTQKEGCKISQNEPLGTFFLQDHVIIIVNCSYKILYYFFIFLKRINFLGFLNFMTCQTFLVFLGIRDSGSRKNHPGFRSATLKIIAYKKKLCTEKPGECGIECVHFDCLTQNIQLTDFNKFFLLAGGQQLKLWEAVS
jgi:hypothetical protein